ncbi:hypothetical protein JAAARDRAFT_69719 [Jaapia argillacea MUCL 33604]|uniref:Uncharacterized protein n=1 Tax=Jaapia argillacea MUCL 33604 TaxID=933084 RepID=A0A067PS30_9AGAM|nr:hypothetical protein JAAARDRAFT_69719 [Jaapia argillacea MUCL 33604]
MMATACSPPPLDHGRSHLSDATMGLGQNARGHMSLYPQGLAGADFDTKDHRYPAAASSAGAANRRVSAIMVGSPTRGDGYDDGTRGSVSPVPKGGDRGSQRRLEPPQSHERWNDPPPQHMPPKENMVSYNVSPGPSRRVVERHMVEDHRQSMVMGNGGQGDMYNPAHDNSLRPRSPRTPGQSMTWDSPSALYSTSRHPSVPATPASGTSNTFTPIMPMSASPTYSPGAIPIPVSPNNRAYAQHPTYITPSSAPNPVNPILSPNPPPQEEVCVECAMRDQDMADVDVTTPGVWDRDSDVFYIELIQREEEEEAAGLPPPDDPSRPRSKGGRLTEYNLKIWLSINPKEPTARQQTVSQYVKSQRMLVEAEVLAKAQALQESRQMDDKMRDAYSQLRRSAYELGNSAAPDDDGVGIRIKTPRSTSLPSVGLINHPREVTLLENGMIVEHVDVRREEKEERERRRKEERRERSRARKSSRGSAIDVMSVYSAQSPLPHTDSGFHSGLKPSVRYSQSSSARPNSVLTLDRPTIPRAYSQASFSDVQSIGSASRRSRFFGLGSLSPGWRSQNSLAPSGMSGSMVDMHVALQREQQARQMYPAVDIGSSSQILRTSQIWPTDATQYPHPEKAEPLKAKKKKKGLARIWRIVTGARSDTHLPSGTQQQYVEKADDDLPLAPPPPLSYLVDRRRSGITGDPALASLRQSMPSLSSSPSYALSSPGMSPATAPSSLLSSPASSRKSGPEREGGNDTQTGDDSDARHAFPTVDGAVQMGDTRNLQFLSSDPDMRGRRTTSPSPVPVAMTPPPQMPSTRPAVYMRREKSLPPLPDENEDQFPTNPRPQTLYTYQTPLYPNDFVAPQAPFRNGEVRRQSFGGLSSRPQLPALTMPVKSGYTSGATDRFNTPVADRYNEFGASRRSLGRLDDMSGQTPEQSSSQLTQTPSKRKSRFGLPSLFGRKSTLIEAKDMNAGSDYAAWLASDPGARYEVASGHSTLPRMSVISRKNIEELVEQDPEFVAYRYPSSDQRLDLLR